MEIDILLKILLSALLSGIIALEREISSRHGLLKPTILIAVTSTFITVLSINLFSSINTVDPTRLIAHLVTAAGLIGAAIVIQARFSNHGLTTAAVILTVSAIGITVGCGHYLLAFLLSILIFAILTASKTIIQILEKQKKLYAYIIKTNEKASLIIEIKKLIIEMGIKYINANLSKTDEGYTIELVFTTSETKNRGFLERILQIEGVNEILSEKF